MKKILAAVAVALAGVFVLTGCASENVGGTGTSVGGNGVFAAYVDLPDGTNVLCVITAGAKGIDCNW